MLEKRLVCALASVVAVLAISVGQSGLARGEATAPGDVASPVGAPALEGRIVFARAGGRYGDETIFVADADGSQQRGLTKAGVSCCPRITRDGRRILFSAQAPDGRITTAIMRFDGTGYRIFTLPDKTINLGPGAWSTSGKRIAFQAWDDDHPDRKGLYVARSSDGRGLRRLTRGPDLPGDFSPDGRRIAFFRELPDLQSVGSIWIVKVDGSGLRRLTPVGMEVGFGTVRWSPDGSKILFQDARNQPEGALWTIHPDGSALTQMFKDPAGQFAISPTWSPDGAWIMFALDPTADEYAHPANAIYVIRSDGTGLTPVITDRNFKREPEWVR